MRVVEELKRRGEAIRRKAGKSAKGGKGGKKDPDAPFDIVNKRIFWLDTDGLFSSGDATRINESFQKIMNRLYRTPESILMIEDMPAKLIEYATHLTARRDLADLERAGDAAASLVFREAFRALGETVAPYVERFGPRAVVVGGSIARAWDLVEPPLTAGLGDALRLRECSVVRARASEAAVLGAGWYAAEIRAGLRR